MVWCHPCMPRAVNSASAPTLPEHAKLVAAAHHPHPRCPGYFGTAEALCSPASLPLVKSPFPWQALRQAAPGAAGVLAGGTAPAHSAGCPGAQCPAQLLPLVPSHGDQLPAVILYTLSIPGSIAIPCPNICTPFSGDCTSVPRKCLSELSRCAESLGVPTGLCSPSLDTFVLKVLHRLWHHINLPFYIPAPKAQWPHPALPNDISSPDKVVAMMETAQSRDPSVGSSKLQWGRQGMPSLRGRCVSL